MTGRGDRSQAPVACESTKDIFDAHILCEQSTTCEGTAGDIPDTIVDVLETEIADMLAAPTILARGGK
jgi:hypothetical protein